jgi:hypothetical protein
MAQGSIARGLNGLSQERAVYQALNQFGDQTSLAFIKNEAEILYGSEIRINQVCASRSYWRLRKGITRDNRTYQGQPRRHMLKDNVVPSRLQQRINVSLNAATKRALLTFINQFHSKEQLRTALRYQPAPVRHNRQRQLA